MEKEKFRQIGIDLINEYRQQRGIRLLDWLVIDTPETSAFIRSIQLHEKTKQELADCKQELSDFRQEVSDVASVCAQHFCENSWTVGDRQDHVDMLSRFIIPAAKPDPLAQTLGDFDGTLWEPEDVLRFRAALAARGLEIREKNDD